MKTLLCLAVLFVAAPVYACDGALALSDGCYSQNLRHRIVVEKVVEPVYVEKIVVERPRIERIVKRERVVERVKRVRRPIVQRSRVVERIRSY